MSIDTSTAGLIVLGFGIMAGPTDMDAGAKRGSDDPGYYEALGRAIRVLRTERGLERKDLAEAAGLSYPYLSEIETGRKRASSKALFVIAEALGVRPSELLALGDRYGGRTSAAPPAAVAPAPGPMVMPSAARPMASAPPAGDAGPVPPSGDAGPVPPSGDAGPIPPAGGWRWFEREGPRADADAAGRSVAGEPAPGDDDDRRRLLDELARSAAGLSVDDLAALLDLARRLAR
jgi:DNA-binding XRE family transcriptional regulator